MVLELRNLEYSDRLRELNLYTLEQRRERGDLIEAYKIITGKENIECEKFFKFRDNSNTRGNSMKIYKPRLKRNILQRVNFFSIRVVNTWNELPDYVIQLVQEQPRSILQKKTWGHRGIRLTYNPHHPNVM